MQLLNHLSSPRETSRLHVDSIDTYSPTLEKFFKLLDSRCEELGLSKREIATGAKTAIHPERHPLYGFQQFLNMSGV